MTDLYSLDLDVFRAIHVGWHSSAADLFFLVTTYTGLGQVQVIFALLLLRSKETKAWVVPLIVGILFSGMAVVQTLKKLIPRERPSNLAFARPQEGWLAQSFPSGHTTTSFCIATLLILYARGTRFAKVSWLSLPWAFLVGISRIYRGVHWPTDTLAGAGIGISSGALLYYLFQRYGQAKTESTQTAPSPGT